MLGGIVVVTTETRSDSWGGGLFMDQLGDPGSEEKYDVTGAEGLVAELEVGPLAS